MKLVSRQVLIPQCMITYLIIRIPGTWHFLNDDLSADVRWHWSRQFLRICGALVCGGYDIFEAYLKNISLTRAPPDRSWPPRLHTECSEIFPVDGIGFKILGLPISIGTEFGPSIFNLYAFFVLRLSAKGSRRIRFLLALFLSVVPGHPLLYFRVWDVSDAESSTSQSFGGVCPHITVS